MNEPTLDWDEPIKRPFVVFTDGTTTVTFDDDNPAKGTNNYGRSELIFKVNDVFCLGVSSTRLMNALKEFKPLKGKTLRISRTGERTEIQYSVVQVKK